jgi:glycosyltransferase involved in cell wall biosynthesis
MAPGQVGGIAQVVMGLTSALGKLEGPEEYTLVVRTREQGEWLRPYCGPNQKIVHHEGLGERGGSYQQDRASSIARALKGAFRPCVRYLQHLLSPPRHWPEVPVSDGFFESLGCDVVHFPTQWFMLCNLPSVYNPHDLQHLVYPQYMTQVDYLTREVLYPAGCRFSHTVVVGTQFIKDDVVRQYRIAPEKIQVIPWASPTEFYTEPDARFAAAVREKYGLDKPFALYPAVTWPHKNHLRLLEALARLRDSRGLVVPLVCTGSCVEPTWGRIQALVSELNLGPQVKFLGFVPDDDLRALYRLSQMLVMPTLYEADSNPIHEAWYEGTPVASSNCTALPDQVHDAGVLFDPRDVDAIADAIARLATDPALCDELRERGHLRARDFSWERTAKAYRAVYRRAGDKVLSEEDRWLLEWDWLREPRKVPQRGAQ